MKSLLTVFLVKTASTTVAYRTIAPATAAHPAPTLPGSFRKKKTLTERVRPPKIPVDQMLSRPMLRSDTAALIIWLCLNVALLV
jgi:hypothetical protein